MMVSPIRATRPPRTEGSMTTWASTGRPVARLSASSSLATVAASNSTADRTSAVVLPLVSEACSTRRVAMVLRSRARPEATTKSTMLVVSDEALEPSRSVMTPLLRSVGMRGSVSASRSSADSSNEVATRKSSSATRSASPSALAISKIPAAYPLIRSSLRASSLQLPAARRCSDRRGQLDRLDPTSHR